MAISLDALGSFRPLATLIGWSFLPRLLATLLLSATYNILSIKPKTREQALLHSQISHSLVVGLYLAYTMYDAYSSLALNYFELLQVPPLHFYGGDGDAFDADLKRSWKRVVLAFHPDKVGNSKDIQARFVIFRQAYETLEDPLKRAAFDRFGPALVKACELTCKTSRDYMQQGLMSSIGFYIASLVMLSVLSVLKALEFGQYWRYTTLFLAFGLEVALLLRPIERPPFWRFLPLVNRLTLADTMVLLHQLVFSINCALSQIGPLLFMASPFASQNKALQQAQIEAAALVPALKQSLDANRLLEMEMRTMAGNEVRAVGSLQEADLREQITENMADVRCELRLRGSKEGWQIWDDAVHRALFSKENAGKDVTISKAEETESESIEINKK